MGRFRYGNRYLERPEAIEIDPFQLPLGNAVREFTKLKGIPGAVRDAAPDAWGRRVIEHKLQRGPADLEEIDYLLHGPRDGAGNLSFGLTREPPGPLRPYNRTQQLADLVAAADAIDAGRRVPEHLLEQLEPGTSMGGARPKATLEHEGRLWLGKFPERRDRVNLQRVEYATLDLARRCSLDVCHATLHDVSERDVLMLERFDRQPAPRERGGVERYLRLGFVSGLTLVGADDSIVDRERWSYPLLADQLRRWSIRPDEDCRELFRRMVFNGAVTNNDDHPRNHALVRGMDGWRLSPAYDLVPVAMVSQESRDLAMIVGAHGRAASLYNFVSQSERFGLSDADARREVERIAETVCGWRERFYELGVTHADVEQISGAFLPECFFFNAKPAAVW